MLAIRFLRAGKKNQPFFRIVVTDKKNPPRGGRFLEMVGFFNPLTKEKKLKAERIKYWLSVGAQPSDTVHNLLVAEKVIEGKKIDVHKKPKKKEKKAEEEKPTETKEEPKEETAKEAKEEKPAEKPKEEIKEEKEAPSEEAKKQKEKPKEAPREEKPKKPPQPLDK